MLTIKALKDTLLKKKPQDSSSLTENELVKVDSGKKYDVKAIKPVTGNHHFITLSHNAGDWYIYDQHWDLGSNLVNLKVPYLSQRDNFFKPHQTCNVTSVAMVLEYFLGEVKEVPEKMQLEDYLYSKLKDKGQSNYVHEDLSNCIKSFGVNNTFKTDATWEEIKTHLRKGFPVIVSGKFTRSGHIIVARGFDNSGFWVNDPYGEVMGLTQKYQNTSGENLHYSNALMEWAGSQQASEGKTWAHFPSKEGFNAKLTPKNSFNPQSSNKEKGIYYDVTPQRKIFLDLIAWCEGTDKNLNSEATGYNIQFGYRTFSDMSKHPMQVISSGGYNSTAAGRYQIMDFTEEDILNALPNLPSFEPIYQDQRTLYLLNLKHGLKICDRLDLNEFCNVFSWTWASIPPGRYGQPTKNIAQIEKAFSTLRGIYGV